MHRWASFGHVVILSATSLTAGGQTSRHTDLSRANVLSILKEMFGAPLDAKRRFDVGLGFVMTPKFSKDSELVSVSVMKKEKLWKDHPEWDDLQAEPLLASDFEAMLSKLDRLRPRGASIYSEQD